MKTREEIPLVTIEDTTEFHTYSGMLHNRTGPAMVMGIDDDEDRSNKEFFFLYGMPYAEEKREHRYISKKDSFMVILDTIDFSTVSS